MLLEERQTRHGSFDLGLSLATFASFQLGHPISFLSFSAVPFQVSLAVLLFCLPSGFQVRAFWSFPFPFLRTCTIYCRLRILMFSLIVWVRILSLSTQLLILFGESTRNILIRHLFWHASHFFMSATVILQHSDPYISIDLTLYLYIFTLVLTLYLLNFHTWFRDRKALLPLCNLDFMASLVPPKYVKSYISLSHFWRLFA